jgi:hypothetical protein
VATESRPRESNGWRAREGHPPFLLQEGQPLKRLATILAVVILSLAMAGVAGANMVINGGFETGDWTGWTPTYASSSSFLEITAQSAAVYDGTHAAIFSANGTEDDTLSQSITTVAGQSYTFAFYLNHNGSYASPTHDDFHVYWNGSSILDLANTAFPYTLYSYTVKATGTTSTIAFAGREFSYHYGLDDVSLTETPLPGSLLLLSSGLLGLLGFRRIRK